jgi:Domain of unknown function (DUF4864)
MAATLSIGPAAGVLSRRMLCGASMMCLLWPPAASAAPLADQDARAVRQVIEAQLEAFAAGDADRAYSYASPEIRAQFGDAKRFIAMVRSGYPMIIRPAAVSFFLPQLDEGPPQEVKQLVRFRDPEGRFWIATYLLQRQADAGWLIGGCMVVADSGNSSARSANDGPGAHSQAAAEPHVFVLAAAGSPCLAGPLRPPHSEALSG